MPTGIEESLVVATTMEVATETATEVAAESTIEFNTISDSMNSAISDEVLLSEHNLELIDIQKFVDYVKEREILRDSNVRGILGENLSKLELERRGNTILEEQPKYQINPETNRPFKADFKVRTEPGSSFRELQKIGDHYSVKEKIFSNQQEFLLDVKNHSVKDLDYYLPDTLEKINRMQISSTENMTIISIPEDTALDPLSASAIAKMHEAGATVITHAPDNITWSEVLRLLPSIQKTTGVL